MPEFVHPLKHFLIYKHFETEEVLLRSHAFQVRDIIVVEECSFDKFELGKGHVSEVLVRLY